MDNEEKGNLQFKIEIVREPLLDKKGKIVKDPEGQESYKREDYNGLMSLLNGYDSRSHTINDAKIWIKLKDKIYKGWIEDAKEIELSLDEAHFLKTYLENYATTDGKDRPLREFEMRTLVGVLEQLK